MSKTAKKITLKSLIMAYSLPLGLALNTTSHASTLPLSYRNLDCEEWDLKNPHLLRGYIDRETQKNTQRRAVNMDFEKSKLKNDFSSIEGTLQYNDDIVTKQGEVYELITEDSCLWYRAK